MTMSHSVTLIYSDEISIILSSICSSSRMSIIQSNLCPWVSLQTSLLHHQSTSHLHILLYSIWPSFLD